MVEGGDDSETHRKHHSGKRILLKTPPKKKKGVGFTDNDILRDRLNGAMNIIKKRGKKGTKVSVEDPNNVSSPS